MPVVALSPAPWRRGWVIPARPKDLRREPVITGRFTVTRYARRNMTVITFLLALGATARITRLINADMITARLRLFVWERYGENSHLGVLVRCPWCASPYVAAVVLGAGWASHQADWWTYAAAVLSISHVVALAAAWLDDE